MVFPASPNLSTLTPHKNVNKDVKDEEEEDDEEGKNKEWHITFF